ncbi:MAG: argininosuccinate lyase [Candidatus Omnitrophica bacterium]|nr:argininosuccinate lyase [Candidatus Omnitrophota bacterium]
MAKMWGGRFKKELAENAKAYSYSLAVDQALLEYDVQASCAHVQMLGRQKIISAAEAHKIVKGLKAIGKEYADTDLTKFATKYEDIHSFIQAKLEAKIGPAAKKMHTARSRNDLVITATKLYLKENSTAIIGKLVMLQKALVRCADKYKEVIIPGLTHVQHAQVVLLAHHILSYVEMLERDKTRFANALELCDELPLGSGSISGTTLPIDRAYVAKQLGFKRVSKNSMDAVSDRDTLVEFLSACAIFFMHVSRLSEDLILWNSQEFGFIELSDEYSTGSSLMPNKKNPDMLELCRGRAGAVYGNLISLLVTMKGLPMAYNRDMQEDKKPLFETVDLTRATLDVLSGLIMTTTVNTSRCMLAVHDSYLYATDLLDYFVERGCAFADAHTLVGKIIMHSQQNGKDLAFFSLNDFKRFFPKTDKKVFECFKPERSIARKNSIGATGNHSVARRIQYWKRTLR